MKYIKIFETYSSQKDLEELSSVVLDYYTDKIVDMIESKFFVFNYNKLPVIELSQLNPDIYNTISDFVKENGELQFNIVGRKGFYNYKNGEKAQYIVDKDNNQLIQILGDSIFSDGNSIVDNINGHIDKWDGEWDKTDFGYSSPKYDTSYHKMVDYIKRDIDIYHSSLLHELQHAFDNWRSKGKYQSSNNKFHDNETKASLIRSKESLDEDEQKFISKHYKDYLNLRYEVDARFTQAIKKIEFHDVEWDLTTEYSIGDFLYVMIPFEKVFKSFKRLYHGYKDLYPKEKRRVDKKLGQFFEMERDFIMGRNIKEVLKNETYSKKSYKFIKNLLLKWERENLK